MIWGGIDKINLAYDKDLWWALEKDEKPSGSRKYSENLQ
jgi:hypothetical protein